MGDTLTVIVCIPHRKLRVKLAKRVSGHFLTRI